MSNNSSGTMTAIGASYPYSKEELSSMMDELTKEVNSVAIKSGIDPGKWAAATTDAWKKMYPNVSNNLVVVHGYDSFESAAQESLRRLREKHGYKQTISIKVPITVKPKANQSAQPVQQETAQAETKLETEPETTDTPDSNLGSSSEDVGIVNVPDLETGKEPLSERDEAERIIRKLCLERGGIPPMSDLMSATGRGNKTLKDWFYPSWEWPERFGVDWSSELQRTKAKAAKEKAAAEEAARAAEAAAAAATSNIDEEVEEIESIEEELPVEDVVDDKPEEPDDEESEEPDAKSENDEESEGSDEESEDDEESEESEEEQSFNEETHYTVPPGFSGEISFKFENKSDEELDIWLYFSKFLKVELDVKMSGKRVFLTTSDDG